MYFLFLKSIQWFSHPLDKYKFLIMTYNLASQNVINSSINTTWALDASAEYQALCQTYWSRVCLSTKFPGNSYAQ